ncbi:dimethylamine monooxygenase subunit DmmA family protein [Acidithiobacillus sulfuriphilus]|uniref:Dimethylamine monooxygenase subunit DmmA family protein n=1 Tax=Acidithiobacillus sulfuriphilus TaxID=1867749 RepID=A0ACD5HR96_9PROT|nr:dimethylamine monooxygenase subunit DmmA family protein [Acidithiobacillus sulfuriphilus]
MFLRRSTPLYTELVPTEAANQHIIASNCNNITSLMEFTKKLPPLTSLIVHLEIDSDDIMVLDGLRTDERFQVITHKPQCGITHAMLDTLNKSSMGTVVYFSGDEIFIWSMVKLAKKVGITDGNIILNKCGSKRNVYCAHCSTINIADNSSIIQCNRCGTSLFVRNHFSRRMGAYLGVRVDD